MREAGTYKSPKQRKREKEEADAKVIAWIILIMFALGGILAGLKKLGWVNLGEDESKKQEEDWSPPEGWRGPTE